VDTQQVQLNFSPSVVAVGMVTLDYLYILDSFPAEGSTNPARTRKVVAGGPIGRGAITAGRLGARVTLLGMCGDDIHADVLRGQLAREPVKTILVGRRQPSQHSFVLAADDTASRTIVWTPQPRADDQILASLDRTLSGADVVLLDCTDPALSAAAMEICRDRRIPTVIDTGSYRESCEAYLSRADHIIAPEKFFSARHPDDDLATAIKRSYEDFDPVLLAATRGERGGVYRDRDGAHSYRAHTVAALDSSGAGDTFHGAFAWALAAGAPTQDAMTIAAWAAARKCAGIGNDTIPGQEELLAHLPRLLPGPPSRSGPA